MKLLALCALALLLPATALAQPVPLRMNVGVTEPIVGDMTISGSCEPADAQRTFTFAATDGDAALLGEASQGLSFGTFNESGTYTIAPNASDPYKTPVLSFTSTFTATFENGTTVTGTRTFTGQDQFAYCDDNGYGGLAYRFFSMVGSFTAIITDATGCYHEEGTTRALGGVTLGSQLGDYYSAELASTLDAPVPGKLKKKGCKL
jgi:hypothetical protein